MLGLKWWIGVLLALVFALGAPIRGVAEEWYVEHPDGLKAETAEDCCHLNRNWSSGGMTMRVVAPIGGIPGFSGLGIEHHLCAGRWNRKVPRGRCGSAACITKIVSAKHESFRFAHLLQCKAGGGIGLITIDGITYEGTWAMGLDKYTGGPEILCTGRCSP